MEKWLKSSVSLRVISIVSAVLIWFYVILVLDPDITVNIDDVPVSYLNYAQLEKQGLRFVGNKDIKVRVRISGKRSIIAKAAPESFNAVADLSGISWPGTRQLSVKVAAPEGISIRETSPAQFTVTLDRFDSVTLPVSVNVKGTPKEGYYLYKVKSNPDKVTFTGPSQIMSGVAQVSADIDVSGSGADVNTTSSIRLVDKNGNTVTAPEITKNADTAALSAIIYRRKELPVQVDTIGAVNDKYNLRTEVQPATVTVSGPAANVDAMQFVPTKPVDVSGLKESKDVFADILLSDGMSLPEGQSARVRVKLILERK